MDTTTRRGKDNSLFHKLDENLGDSVESHYFNEPRDFRSLVEVLNVLGTAEAMVDTTNNNDLLSVLKDNPAYSKLLNQQKAVYSAIEQVVMYQHGGLNSTVETMTDVLKAYSHGRSDVQELRRSLAETQEVLTAKKSGQMSMKDLWLKKIEAEQSLKLLRDVELLRDVSPVINRMAHRRKYFSAVKKLNHSISIMFSDDMVGVSGLSQVRQNLMDIKSHLLEEIVVELQNVIFGLQSDKCDLDSVTNQNKEYYDIDDVAKSDCGRDDDNRSQPYISASRRSDQMDAKAGGLFASRNTDDWDAAFSSVDLLGLDEDGEVALTDYTTSAGLSLFLRYLVRAVGELQYEQDAERLVLDHAKTRFLDITRILRERAIVQRTKLYQEYGSSSDITGLETDMFVAYANSWLDCSRDILLRLLYVLRLLSIMRKLRVGDVDPYSYTVQSINKEAVLETWSYVQAHICEEFSLHFVEQCIEDISDTARISQHYMQDEDGILSSIMRCDERRSASAMKSSQKNTADLFGTTEERAPVFTTSSRLCAPLYVPVVKFTEFTNRLLEDEGIVEPNTPDKCHVLLRMMSSFLTSDVVPLIQLTVNSHLREIQMDSTLLTVSALALGSEPLQSPQSETIDTYHSALCGAASLCDKAARPLFKYWLQLPQNSEMILTILERLIIGFIGTVKEEIDNVAWALLGYQDQNRKKLAQHVRDNGMFLRYRRGNFGDNIHVVDNSDIGIATNSSGKPSNTLPQDAHSTGGPPSTAGSNHAVSGGYHVQNAEICSNKELLIWTNLWSLAPPSGKTGSDGLTAPYPTMKLNESGKEIGDLMVKDFSKIRTLASIIRGCDWFSNELCHLSAEVIKSDTENIISSQIQAKNGKNVSYGTKHSNQIRTNLIERTSLLRHTVHQCSKDLAKVALETLATLRGEIQVACFHFLYPLIRLNYSSNVHDKEIDGEDIVDDLHKYLEHFRQAVSCALPPQAVAVIFAPLCKLLPLVLMMHLCYAVETNLVPTRHFDRAKPFKVIVAAQKSLTHFLQSLSLNQDIMFGLEETLAASFEHVRRYVTLLDMNASSLNHYIKANLREFSANEFYALYKRAHEGASRNEFESFCRSVSNQAVASKNERSARFR